MAHLWMGTLCEERNRQLPTSASCLATVVTLSVVTVSIPMAKALDAAGRLALSQSVSWRQVELPLGNTRVSFPMLLTSKALSHVFRYGWIWLSYFIFPTVLRTGHFNWTHFPDRKTGPPGGKQFAPDSGYCLDSGRLF